MAGVAGVAEPPPKGRSPLLIKAASGRLCLGTRLLFVFLKWALSDPPAPRRPEWPPRRQFQFLCSWDSQEGLHLSRPRNSEYSRSFWDKQTTSSAAATPQQREPSEERGRKRGKKKQQHEMLVSRAFQQCVFFFFAGLFVGGSVCCFSPHAINQHQNSR